MSARSFVDVVQEMAAEGETFEDVVSNLKLLGLSQKDAERLFSIVETKSIPQVEDALREMVKLKLEAVDKAWQVKRIRRASSKARRRSDKVKEIKYGISALLRDEASEKIPVFRQRVDNYLKAMEQGKKEQKKILAFLLQLENQGLLRRHNSNLRKAIDFFKEG